MSSSAGVRIHFEDCKGTDAIRLLARYKDKYLVLNDDIQGTASITIAGLTTALQINGERLADQGLLFAGAGSAGIGIADMIVEAMQDEGLTQDDARARIAMYDANGLLDAKRDDLSPSQKVYAKDLPATSDLAASVQSFKPTVLIGVSTTHGLFTEDVVKGVAANTDRPIVFPLSNPTDKAECTPEQAFTWTDGKVLFAAGVQFPDVTVGGKTYHPGQANNFYIFPAFGLAIYATRSKRIDDKGMLFPPQRDILETEITLQFGTELLAARDKSIVALLGASPGASTAAWIAIELLQKVFADKLTDEGWLPRLKEIIPTYGIDLKADAEACRRTRAETAQLLGLRTA